MSDHAKVGRILTDEESLDLTLGRFRKKILAMNRGSRRVFIVEILCRLPHLTSKHIGDLLDVVLEQYGIDRVKP
ncbi:MAG: hypothetical protein V1809_10460 [Planctomycetota bacterium]